MARAFRRGGCDPDRNAIDATKQMIQNKLNKTSYHMLPI
jgi:hypothetical protein